jgi:hypothetical protein
LSGAVICFDACVQVSGSRLHITRGKAMARELGAASNLG